MPKDGGNALLTGRQDRIDVVVLGGFLGAGKSTALSRLARMLTGKGRKVGIVTNDQGRNLVDTKIHRHLELPVVEVVGGCFCCRFDDLVEQAEALIERAHVDVILAEPVGSCTDLVATVCRPLRMKYGEALDIKPFTVMVDPLRARELLHSQSNFLDNVKYLFTMQLQEADVILLNKIDTLSAAERDEILLILRERFNPAWIAGVSALTGEGIEEWWAMLNSLHGVQARSVDVDYARYAEAEFELGWLNAELKLHSPVPFDPALLMDTVLGNLISKLKAQSAEVAHVKFWVVSPSASFRISMTSLRDNPRWDGKFSSPCTEMQVMVNARVAMDPERLRETIGAAFEDGARPLGVFVDVEQMEAFRPAPPRPTYRIV